VLHAVLDAPGPNEVDEQLRRAARVEKGRPACTGTTSEEPGT
jgi:hypothetical protein